MYREKRKEKQKRREEEKTTGIEVEEEMQKYRVEVSKRREVQSRDVEERSRYCPRTGVDTKEQKIEIEEEKTSRIKNEDHIRIERQETSTNQKTYMIDRREMERQDRQRRDRRER